MWHMKENQRTRSHSRSANNNSMMESRMRLKAHVRFGEGGGETCSSKGE
jgi:hypothetical protein